MTAERLKSVALTFLFGAAGGLGFTLLGLPAPWLSGAMIGVVVQMLIGLHPVMPDPLRDLGMLLAGIVMGSAVTPQMLQAMGRYPLSLLLLALTIAVITIVGRMVLETLFRWRRADSILASLPGAMSSVLALAAESGANMAKVATIQAARMFVLVALLPSLVAGATGAARPIVLGATMGLGDVALIASGGLALAFLFLRLRILAPFLLAGMASAAATHATAFVTGELSPLIANGAMLLIGLFAGSRLKGVLGDELKSLALPAIVLFVITTFIAVIGAVVTSIAIGIPLPETFVAFAPGGLEAMVVLGIALGLDPLYVSSHHIARFVLISAGMPLIWRWMAGPPPQADG